jgi:hypothetical protein
VRGNPGLYVASQRPKLWYALVAILMWLLKKSLEVPQLPKLGDQKCIPRWRKSFIRHPSASSFQGESAERVFQQPQAIAQVCAVCSPTRKRRYHSRALSGQYNLTRLRRACERPSFC